MNIYVGLSGGVDSSVTAALLKEEGHMVTGVYMKNWATDLPGFECPWREDYMDAKRVAVRLGIDFKMYDFQKEYKEFVVDYMIDEYKNGRTPNPDIMCNQEVKFKLFLQAALHDGADAVATGHYAATQGGRLYKATDANKDQTYFLYRVTKAALNKTFFPLGVYSTKQQVRALAEKFNLPTAQKKESMGICFVGKVGIHDFLDQYVQSVPGAIIDEDGREIGTHEGAIFYTIGQRHGLNVGGGLPYYVIGKDMDKNEVYVTRDINDTNLWKESCTITNIHWINDQPDQSQKLQVRLRHRGPLVDCNLQGDTIHFSEQQKAVAAGQSAVLYAGDECLGGGIII